MARKRGEEVKVLFVRRSELKGGTAEYQIDNMFLHVQQWSKHRNGTHKLTVPALAFRLVYILVVHIGPQKATPASELFHWQCKLVLTSIHMCRYPIAQSQPSAWMTWWIPEAAHGQLAFSLERKQKVLCVLHHGNLKRLQVFSIQRLCQAVAYVWRILSKCLSPLWSVAPFERSHSMLLEAPVQVLWTSTWLWSRSLVSSESTNADSCCQVSLDLNFGSRTPVSVVRSARHLFTCMLTDTHC